MPAKLSTHVLDTAHGCPASGMKIELWSLDGDERTLVITAKTNAEGRTETPLLAEDEMGAGQYEILFFAGDYFAAEISQPAQNPFSGQNSHPLRHRRRRCQLSRSPALLALVLFDVSRKLMRAQLSSTSPTAAARKTPGFTPHEPGPGINNSAPLR